MKWTKQQLKLLKYYAGHRDHTPTITEVNSQISLSVLIWFVISIALGVVLYLCGLHALAYLLEGASIGGILRSVVHKYELIELWPALAAIVDFDKAQSLVDEVEGERNPQ